MNTRKTNIHRQNKTKKRYLFNPRYPNKSFDVYIDKILRIQHFLKMKDIK
jgi:hypothetical protein